MRKSSISIISILLTCFSTRSTDTNGKILQDGRGTTAIPLSKLLEYANEGSIILSEILMETEETK